MSGGGSDATRCKEQATPTRAPGGLTRVTINLTQNASDAVDWLASETGDTKTDTINRALMIYRFIEETTRKGGALYVREPGQTELERLKLF